jgi:glycosyltransferase involved in cell wall biosynthesis
MFCAVIMPIYNEAQHLDQVLKCFVTQSDPCDLLILVDDGSTDQSAQIQMRWAEQYPWIEVVSCDKKSDHAPGQKVVNAFYRGYEYLMKRAAKDAFSVSLIGKFDGDVLLPPNYFKALKTAFTQNPKLGLASGLLYVKKQNTWVYEQIAKKHKVRGPIKLYRQECFNQIDGLKPCLGWDSIDQWLAQYSGWEVQTFADLQVKHLKATAQGYSPGELNKQGHAFAHMGYGFWLSLLSIIKLSFYYKKPQLVFYALVNYCRSRHVIMVTPLQAEFIRKTLWRSILNNR